jgi:hypothetical protein
MNCPLSASLGAFRYYVYLALPDYNVNLTRRLLTCILDTITLSNIQVRYKHVMLLCGLYRKYTKLKNKSEIRLCLSSCYSRDFDKMRNLRSARKLMVD